MHLSEHAITPLSANSNPENAPPASKPTHFVTVVLISLLRVSGDGLCESRPGYCYESLPDAPRQCRCPARKPRTRCQALSHQRGQGSVHADGPHALRLQGAD